MKRRMKKKKREKSTQRYQKWACCAPSAVSLGKWTILLRPIVSCLSIFNMSFRHSYGPSLAVDTKKSVAMMCGENKTSERARSLNVRALYSLRFTLTHALALASHASANCWILSSELTEIFMNEFSFRHTHSLARRHFSLSVCWNCALTILLLLHCFATIHTVGCEHILGAGAEWADVYLSCSLFLSHTVGMCVEHTSMHASSHFNSQTSQTTVCASDV